MTEMQEKLQLEARLMAIEFTLGKLISSLFSQGKKDVVGLMLDNWTKGASTQTFPGMPPATSDLFAQEYEAAIRRLLEGVKELSDEQRANRN